jgi:8-oxo-dGTP pyrophosphatase MutT (NUDIX family)
MLPTDLAGLRRQVEGPLPGHDAFMALSGYKRPDLASVMAQVPPPRASAVLIALHPHQGELHTVLMVRPEYDGVHAGQVGFPGGHREPMDADDAATALREFQEEMGADVAAFEVLRALTPVYIPPSRSLVIPVLAYVPELGPLAPDPREVAAVIHTPVAHLLRDDILKRTRVHVRTVGQAMQVPYWDVQGHVVWGATAMMIAELRELFLRGR